MINYLKDIKKLTLIGLLPDIINSNNESIRNEFNWIFDSSLNRLTKSVYAPTGSVKAHFGEFVNLACEYFTVKNVDSLKASILDSVESIIRDSFDPSTKQITNHNLLNNRFINPEFEDDDLQDFCHDAAAIIYKKDGDVYTSVEDVLDNINSFDVSILEAYDLAKKCDASLNEIVEDIQELNSATDELSNNVESVEQTLETTNSSVNTIENNITNINTSINNLDISVNDLYTHIKLPVVRQAGSATISPNVYNIWNNISNSITISKSQSEDEDYVNEYIIKINNFTSGTITIDSTWGTLKWAKGEYPQFSIGHAYEISIIDNFASYIEYY